MSLARSNFCADSSDIVNNTTYTVKYPRASCLPNGGTGFSSSDLNSNGIVNSASLSNYVNSYISANAAAPTTLTRDISPANKYAEESNAMRIAVNSEYCYYYRRYMYALSKVLEIASTGRGVSDRTYASYKTNAIALNSKLNQILQIVQSIIIKRAETLETYYGSTTGVNGENNDLISARDKLSTHMEQLKKNTMESDVKSAMLDYTIEKNSSSRNLLVAYGFMNIIAISLLYYMYTSK